MTTYTMTGPDGKDYSIDGPPGASQEQVAAQMAAAHQNLGTGPQPTIGDRIAASPIGTIAHGLGQIPMGIGHLLSKIDSTAPDDAKTQAMFEQPYQASLAANRNTPGYAAARQNSDARLATRPSGLTDQFMPTLAPAMAGTAGLFGGSLDASNAARDSQQASQDAYHAAHHYLSTAANIVGGFVAGPEGAASRLPAYAGDNALLTRAANGKVIGPLPQRPIPAPRTPSDLGADYVNSLLAKGGKTTADLRSAAAASNGKPVTTAEAIGNPGEVAVGALARREGQTPDALSGVVTARSAAAPQRILGDYAAASGIDPNAARGDIEAFVDANQKAAGPLYDEAYKANSNIASPMLDRILETPAGKKALGDARVKMQNDMNLMGTPDADLMNQAAEGGTALPAKGAASGMKLRVYDYVKRSLDDQISAAYRAGNNNEANIIKDLKNKMVGELDKADITAKAGPNSLKPKGGLYAQARAKAGEYLSAKKQYDAGQEHILDHNFTAKDFSDYYSKLGPADQQAYMGGVANKLFNLQQSAKLKADIFKAPVIQSKLASVMGPQKAKAFLQNMQTEQSMANFARLRAPGAGSPTAENAAAMAAQDAPFNMHPDAMDFLGNVAQHGPIKGSVAYGVGKLKDAGAAWATRGMPVPVRDAAGKILIDSPINSAALLDARSGMPKALPRGPIGMPQLPTRSAFPYGLFGSTAQRQNP